MQISIIFICIVSTVLAAQSPIRIISADSLSPQKVPLEWREGDDIDLILALSDDVPYQTHNGDFSLFLIPDPLDLPQDRMLTGRAFKTWLEEHPHATEVQTFTTELSFSGQMEIVKLKLHVPRRRRGYYRLGVCLLFFDDERSWDRLYFLDETLGIVPEYEDGVVYHMSLIEPPSDFLPVYTYHSEP